MDDLIKRADALEQMAQAECGLHYNDCEADNCSCSYIQRILDTPSVDAEQVTSKLKNPCDSLLTDDSAECKEQKSKLESADAKGDLISRQWLLDLYGDYIGDNGDTKYHVPLEVVRQNIIDAPSADAVTIEHIQCRECRHYNGWCDVHFQPRKETDYCNFAERREPDECE